jgi:hypothetical protein
MMRHPALEQLPLLLNFDMDSSHYLTLLLVGEPLLRRTLSLQMHEPLLQRIACNHLDGLSREELDAYLAHQPKAAGVGHRSTRQWAIKVSSLHRISRLRTRESRSRGGPGPGLLRVPDPGADHLEETAFCHLAGAYHRGHEPCWYAVRNGQGAHCAATGPTVWEVANLNPFGGDRDAENEATGHGTQKPVELMRRPF